MKNSPLTTFLLAVLAFSSILSFIFCLLYVSSTVQMRSLQGQVNIINRTTTAVQSLANDALEYSKQNPAIDPILERTRVKVPKAPAGTNKPAAK